MPETSFYPALERLLTAIGKTLSPKVRCVINLANRGAGLPDGGLFSADQFRRKTGKVEAKENPFLIQNISSSTVTGWGEEYLGSRPQQRFLGHNFFFDIPDDLG